MNLDDFERCIAFAERNPPPVAGGAAEGGSPTQLNAAEDSTPRRYGAPRV